MVKDKNDKALPGLAPVAKQEGEFVAEVIKKNIRNPKNQKKFYYKNRGYLATIGRSEAIVDFGWFTLKGKIGWIFWSIVLFSGPLARHGTLLPDGVSISSLIWPLVAIVSFTVIVRWKLSTARTSFFAAEKIRRYGALWECVYAVAWLMT